MLTEDEDKVIVVCINVMEFLRAIIEAHIRLIKEGITPCPFMPTTKMFHDTMKPIVEEVMKLKDKHDISVILESIMEITKLIDIHDKIRIRAHQEGSH